MLVVVETVRYVGFVSDLAPCSIVSALGMKC